MSNFDVKNEENTFVSPGALITQNPGFIKGHGTLQLENQLQATVTGYVERINKLITVKPFKCPRCNGEVGDVVVCRISDVSQKKWKVDIYSRQDASLQLSAVNLPGGELRRRSVEDELMMREYLSENDLISAEVQKVGAEDGQVHLHTRSLKYGKLGQGIMIMLKPSIIKRSKTHFHNLPCGVSCIMGNNGYIWVGGTLPVEDESGGHVIDSEVIQRPEREAITRVVNVIKLLAENEVMIYDTSVIVAYDMSMTYETKDLIKKSIKDELIVLVKMKL